jgi:hypothetical protein
VVGSIAQKICALMPINKHIYLGRTKTSGQKAHAKMWRHLMTVRTSRKTVTFTRPFSLSAIGEVQPAGSYAVETDEELLPGLSFPAYRRIATLIILRSRGRGRVIEEVISIDPLELQAAQDRDSRPAHTLADYHSGYLSAGATAS